MAKIANSRVRLCRSGVPAPRSPLRLSPLPALSGFHFGGCYIVETMNDRELLQRYTADRCETAFAELVSRYVDLVYSAALRQVGGDAALAQDVTQNVFIDLARKASSLSRRTLLSGWLYTSARYAASNLVRAEQRRRAREEEANTMHEPPTDATPEPAWEQLRPVLDAAMHELTEPDRNAVLLRYFEGRQLADVGARLGLTEDAARKRIGRALDKLRELLAKRGLTSTSTALVTILSSQAVTAAPAGLAVNIVSVALSSSASGAGTGLTLFKIMTMTKLKLSLIGALVVAGAATPLVLQQHAQRKLADENQALRQQSDVLASRLAPLLAENRRLSNLVAQAETLPSPQNERSNELLRLRAEVARLRSEARDPSKTVNPNGPNDPAIEATASQLAGRATRLKQRLEQMPNLKIPELQFLKEKDWLDAVSNLKQLDTEEDFRNALNNLRRNAKSEFGVKLQKSLRQFTKANGGVLPSELSQLQPYFDPPVDAALLSRYQLLQTGRLADLDHDQRLVAEVAPPVDDEYDSRFEFGLNGTDSHSVNKMQEAMETAATAYANANNGLLPRDATQVAPYLQQPIDPVRVQKFLSSIPPEVTTLDQIKTHR